MKASGFHSLGGRFKSLTAGLFAECHFTWTETAGQRQMGLHVGGTNPPAPSVWKSEDNLKNGPWELSLYFETREKFVQHFTTFTSLPQKLTRSKTGGDSYIKSKQNIQLGRRKPEQVDQEGLPYSVFSVVIGWRATFTVFVICVSRPGTCVTLCKTTCTMCLQHQWVLAMNWVLKDYCLFFRHVRHWNCKSSHKSDILFIFWNKISTFYWKKCLVKLISLDIDSILQSHWYFNSCWIVELLNMDINLSTKFH